MIKKYEVKTEQEKELFLFICEKALAKDTKDWEEIYKCRNILFRAEYLNKDLVIKSFGVPRFFKRVFYSFFGETKAFRAYHNGIKLQQMGGYTAEVLGYMEVYSHRLIKESFFICENLLGYREIRPEMKGEGLDDVFVDALVHFIVGMHQKGIYHRDLSPGNILYRPQDMDFKVVDINRLECFDNCLDFDTSVRSLYRLSDGKAEILSSICSRYAELRGFDVDLFVDEVATLSDKFFVKKMYKWSISRPEFPHKNKFLYLLNLMFFCFSKCFRHLLKKGYLYKKMKEKESSFYYKYLHYNDVRGVMIKKEGYKIN